MQTPGDFYLSYQSIAERKARNQAGRLFLLAILAGVLIGMGAMTSTLTSYGIENPSLSQLVKGLVFPFGLILVIFTGAELFTGNNLLFLGRFSGKLSPKEVLHNWCWVYLGNFVGSILLACLYVYSGNLVAGKPDLALAILQTAKGKCSLAFGQAMTLGLLCNFLVCLAVMAALMSPDGISKAVAAYLPVAFFVWAGFEHSVANMYYIPAGLFLKGLPGMGEVVAAAGLDLSALTWGNFFLHNLLPVTLGNILGGFLYSGLVYLGFRPKGSAH